MTEEQRERKRKYDLEWHKKHPGYNRERARQYYWDHKEERRAYAREYYAAHKEQALEYQKRYRAEHAEELKRKRINRRLLNDDNIQTPCE